MKKILLLLSISCSCLLIGWNIGINQNQDGYILENDIDVATDEPGSHNGGGQTIGYNFFAKADNFHTVFRKRVLKPGSAIGYHLQKNDEIYYVLTGEGIMQMNGKTFPVKQGDAILTRPGSSHGLIQTGKENLVIIINYQVEK